MAININKKFLVILSLILALLLSGCASIFKAKLPEGAFRLNGTYYIPLVSLCNSYGIELKWDSFTQTVTLKKENNEAKFLIDSPVVLINAEFKIINPPPRFYKGSLVVPLIFKENIIEQFIETQPLAPQRESFYYRGKIKRIVIDPGHGGKDPGAIGRLGLKEKDLNLDIARRLKELLENHGVKVIMTRNADTFVSLEERVDIANRSDTDFFVSIHTNANRSKTLRGFEVYYLSNQSEDINRAIIAANKNVSRFNNMSLTDSSKDLKIILWDMIHAENQAESVRLAKDISVVTSGGLNINNRIKSANFFVLKHTQIPSILIEVGYISNPYEEKKLRNSQYRQDIAEMLAKGIIAE